MKIFEFINQPSGQYGLGGTLLEPTDLLLINDTDTQPILNLSQVLNENNITDGNDIFLSDGDSILLDNNSRLKKGTVDAGNGGNKGIALVCSLDYEMKWEAGRLYVMNNDGFTIRETRHNFIDTPTVTDDVINGFVVGSRWVLDDGTVYICSDNTSGAAVWDELVLNESKWTEVGSDIYRNSDVLIGATTFADATAKLEVIGRVNVSNANNCTHIGFGAGSGETSGVGNVTLGRNAGALNQSGVQNTMLGWVAGYSNTGNDNTLIGRQSGWSKGAGNNNVAVGSATLYTATSGSSNTAIGYAALFTHPNPNNQTAIGFQALLLDNLGTENTALGARCAENLRDTANNSQNVIIGYFAAQANTSMQNSIIIGRNARPAANGQINQIVIGHDLIGSGSNTVTIGNTSVTDTYLRGNVRVPVLLTPASAAPASPVAGMIYYDSTTNKHRGYNGTTWNDLY